MKKTLALLATLTAALAIGVAPALAITDGVPDGDGHPHVGLMVNKQWVTVTDSEGNEVRTLLPRWRCSGTLLSPTVFLTAGHCTFAADSVEIWFAAGPIKRDLNYVPYSMGGTACDDPAVTGYPCWGDVSGTGHTHPEYDDARFYLRDVGVVVLDEAYDDTGGRYGVLPSLNQLDSMATRRGEQDVTFRAVGYGLQYINPVFLEEELTRMVATPHLVQINTALTGDYSILLSNNAATGGTCYGDSGGPNFLGTTDVIGGVTSYGYTDCVGTGGVFRMDRSWALNWVSSFLTP